MFFQREFSFNVPVPVHTTCTQYIICVYIIMNMNVCICHVPGMSCTVHV